MNLSEYRSQWPGLLPNHICKFRSKFMECISYPWKEGEYNLIRIRKPNQPETMITLNVSDLVQLELHCPNCKTISPAYLYTHNYLRCDGCLRRFTLNETNNFCPRFNTSGIPETP